MNHPDDNYDNVHDAIIEELRVEYEYWKLIEHQHHDVEKKQIARNVQQRLLRRANKIKPK